MVETTVQLGHLLDYGCTSAQGYLLSRPVTADELRELFPGDRVQEQLTA